MFFFSNKIKFKKQSQSLALNLNDKQIRKGKGQLIELTKKHLQVDQNLRYNKNLFQHNKQVLILQHQNLQEQQKRHKLKITKLQVRKDQLLAKQNPQIKIKKAQILKKYLKCMIYTIGDKLQIIKSFQSLQLYGHFKRKMFRLEHKLYIIEKKKQIVFMKKCVFQNQQIMIIVKEKIVKQDNKSNVFCEGTSLINSKISQSILNPSALNSTIQGINPSNVYSLNQDNSMTKKIYQFRIFSIQGNAFQMVNTYQQSTIRHIIKQLTKEERSVHLDTFTSGKTLRKQKQVIKRPRLSLQFDPVVIKSFQGFFLKRTSQTSNDLQSKIITLDSLIKQSKKDSRIKIDTDRSKVSVSDKKSIRQSDQYRTQTNVSQMAQIQSRQIISKQKIKTNSKMTKFKQNKFNLNLQSQSQINDPHHIQHNLKKQGDSHQPQNTNPISQQADTSKTFTNKILQVLSTGLRRSFIYGQKILIPDFNPLLNLVILKNKNRFYFLPEYLQIKQNFEKINHCVKKYQLKIKLQKKIRKCLLYKTMKFQNFFQTENQVMSKFNVELLFTVKYAKDDIYILKRSQKDLKNKPKKQLEKQIEKQLQFSQKEKQKQKNKNLKYFNDEDIVICCENIKCESQQNTFLIHQILKQQMIYDSNNKVFNMISNVNALNNRMRAKNQFGQNKKLTIDNSNKQNQKSKEQKLKKKTNKTKTHQPNNLAQFREDDDFKLIQFRQNIQKSFDNFVQSHFLSIKEYRFMKKIDFHNNLSKIITIQKNLKCFYYRKIFKQTPKSRMIYKFEPNSKILICAIHDQKRQSIRVYTECLILRLNQKYKAHPLTFKSLYWNAISSSLSSIVRLSDSVVEVKDQLQKYLTKKIRNFEIQQARIQALKPQLYLNRLRRFFINIMLRVKAKKNILYLKKLYHNSETFVLIIRKSSILKNVYQANIYHLQEFMYKQQNKQNLKQTLDDEKEQISKTTKTINKQSKTKRIKPRYQTINLLKQYFTSIPIQKIADQFYFDTNHFMLKPPKNPSLFYIQRLLAIDVNSEEVAKQITMIQWQEPAKRKKNDNFQLLNVKNFDAAMQQMKSSQIGQNNNVKIPKQNFRLKRKNASVYGLDDFQQKKLEKNSKKVQEKNHLQQSGLMIPHSIQQKQRKSFRVSIRNNCMLANDQKAKNYTNSNNLKFQNNDKKIIRNDSKQFDSKSKLSSGQRISRNSIYDIFNSPFNKKMVYQIQGNGHGKIMYYSLVKVEEVFYEFHLYIVKRKFITLRGEKNDTLFKHNLIEAKKTNQTQTSRKQRECDEQTVVEEQENYLNRKAFSDEFYLVHRQNLTKKQLLQANWTLIYSKIARWIKNNEQLLTIVQSNNNI